MRIALFHAPVFVMLFMSSPSAQTASDPSDVYTLYRDSPSLPGEPLPGELNDGDLWRIHVATFDADAGAAYNQQNCQIAAGLFARQPGVRVRYWCEQGTYKGPTQPQQK